MWKLFICHDTREHPQISQQQTVSSSSFPISGVTAVWRGVICERFSGKPATFFFKLKKKTKKSNRVSDSSVAVVLVVIMISISTSRGKSLKCCLMPGRASSLMETGVLKKPCKSFLSSHPWYPPAERLQRWAPKPELSGSEAAVTILFSLSVFFLYILTNFIFCLFFLIAYFTQLLN